MDNNITENSSCSPYDSPEYAVVAAVSAGLAFLSTILVAFMIAIIILFKKYRFLSQRLILYMAISAILVNLGIILHRVDYMNQMTEFYIRFCMFGGYLDQLSNWMLLNSVCAITIYLLLALFTEKKTEKYELVYIFFIFIFPFTYCWVPFIENSYGRAGAWCWIRAEERIDCKPFKFGVLLQFIIWFVPLYTLMAVLILLYVTILVKLCLNKQKWNRISTEEIIEFKKQVKKDLLPLVLYPLIYFLLNIFPFINRIYNQTHKDPQLGLWYLAALANPSMGAWIALTFTLHRSTRKHLSTTEIKAAARELWQGNTEVHEYDLEDNEVGITKTDSYRRSNGHPYQNYAKTNTLDKTDPKALTSE